MNMPSIDPRFVHLKVRSEFSLVDSLVRIKPLVKTLVEQKMPAVALCDLCNFYGLIKFYQKAIDSGIKPIVGCDFEYLDDSDTRCIVTTLAQNNQGYANLRLLISRGFREGQKQGVPFIQRKWLAELGEGIIVISGAVQGDIGQAVVGERLEDARTHLRWWQAHFPNRFYLEVRRTGRQYEEDYLHQAVDLAIEHNCPIVATNDVRFLHADEYEAHEARVCINEGRALDDPRRVRGYSEEQYFRSEEEMCELFADLPEALANSVEIAKRCHVVGRPVHGGKAIVGRGGEGVLWCKSVIDCDHRHIHLHCDFGAQAVMRIKIADHKAAAMIEDDDRRSRASFSLAVV